MTTNVEANEPGIVGGPEMAAEAETRMQRVNALQTELGATLTASEAQIMEGALNQMKSRASDGEQRKVLDDLHLALFRIVHTRDNRTEKPN